MIRDPCTSRSHLQRQGLQSHSLQQRKSLCFQSRKSIRRLRTLLFPWLSNCSRPWRVPSVSEVRYRTRESYSLEIPNFARVSISEHSIFTQGRPSVLKVTGIWHQFGVFVTKQSCFVGEKSSLSTFRRYVHPRKELLAVYVECSKKSALPKR